MVMNVGHKNTLKVASVEQIFISSLYRYRFGIAWSSTAAHPHDLRSNEVRQAQGKAAKGGVHARAIHAPGLAAFLSCEIRFTASAPPPSIAWQAVAAACIPGLFHKRAPG